MPPSWVLACGFVGVVVLSYVCVRAWRVPLTYDEAASYHRYVVAEPLAIFDFSVATNHFLNSLLTRATASAHGTPFALRLPNVVAAGVYLLACLGIVSFLENAFTRVGGFVVLAMNLYLLDYLALSRGYGLSVALFTGSIYFLLRSALDEPSPQRSRSEKRALALAALAVVANFSALPACLSVGAVVGLRPVGRRFTTLVGPSLPSLLPRTAHLLAWGVLATTFTAMVLNRDTALSDGLYEPVSVRIAGLFEDELNDIQVYRATARGYWDPLSRGPGGVWSTGADRHVRDLRVELPARADRNMTTLEVRLGSQRFLRTRAAQGPWQVADVGTMRRLEAMPELSLPRSSQPHLSGAINWGGDAGHRRLVAKYTVVGITLLSVAAAAIFGAAALAARHAIVDPLAARAVGTMLLWLLPFVSAPVYLLRLHGELYYGGSHGLVRDTFGSLVEGTYYGAQYHPEQITWGLTVLGTSAALLAVVLVGYPRYRAFVAGRIGVVLLAVLTAAALQLWVQRLLLGTPYLLGRTALWLVPLLFLVPLVLSEVVSSMSRHGRLLASTAAIAMGVAASWHAVSHANLTRVADWPRDADTPAMLEAVVATTSSTRPRPPVVRIGVEWFLYPVARYYAALHSTAVTRYDIDVVTSNSQAVDFLYTSQHSPWARGDAIARYPTADAVLTRAPPSR